MKAVSASVIVLAGAVLTTTREDVLVLAGVLIGVVGLVSWGMLICGRGDTSKHDS